MPDVFALVTRYFWIAALFMCAINTLAYQRRFRAFVAQYPERAVGYRRFLIGFVLINLLVWSIMGIGIMVGGLSNVFAFFNPSAGNPYVLAWHASLIAVWIVAIGWMYFRGGAQFLVDHPGLLNISFSKPLFVQLWFGACLLGGILAEYAMWTQVSSIPIP